MKKLITICAVVTLFLYVQGISLAEITLDVYASSAPNAYGSASWNGYVSNAMYALEHGLSAYGDPTSPTYYERAPDVVGAGQIAVTTFNSWQGQVSPSGAFAGELGNRMHFGIDIRGNGNKISISQLSFVMSSSDSTDSLACTRDTGTYDYSTSYVGIDYGADGIKGTTDDAYITSGANTQLVDEIVGRGSGNAWWPGGDLPDAGVGDPQAAMDAYFAFTASEAPITVTGAYLLGNVTGSDSVVVTPEPVTIVLLGLGALGLIRRKK